MDLFPGAAGGSGAIGGLELVLEVFGQAKRPYEGNLPPRLRHQVDNKRHNLKKLRLFLLVISTNPAPASTQICKKPEGQLPLKNSLYSFFVFGNNLEYI